MTGGENRLAPYGEVSLLAMRGDTALAERQIGAVLADVTARGEGVGLNMLGWFQALMYNAVAATPRHSRPPPWDPESHRSSDRRSGPWVSWLRLPHTPVTPTQPHQALEQLSSYARASGTDLALGLTAAKGALLRKGQAAEDCYREALHRLDQTTIKVEQARTRLLYGEWLRREGRRVDARTQLRSAHEALTAMNVRAGFRPACRA